MFFDLHTDILYDVVRKRLNHKHHIIKDDHLNPLLSGQIIGGIWTYYTDLSQPLCEFERAIDCILEEIEVSKDYIHVITKKDDFHPNKLNVIMGFESLQPVKNINELEKLYEYGFRHAMLTWNEENHFATGVLGNDQHGLTEEGIEVIQFMNEHHMIVDVSHANIHTFNDILSITKHPVIASHSNVYPLCPHKRNLTEEQIKSFMNKGGIMGITAVGNFVNPQIPTIKEMVKHINYLRDQSYIQQIGLGFDFMDYLSPRNGNLRDLPSVLYTQRLMDELNKQNYTNAEINCITHLNAINLINQIL